MAMMGEGLGPAVALFHSLADRTRLAIVQRLAQGEARVVDLTAELGLAQSTVSKHLACLRDCGLVDFRAEARQSFYSLTRPELIDLLAAAEGLLGATGSAVALCPTYGRSGPAADAAPTAATASAAPAAAALVATAAPAPAASAAPAPTASAAAAPTASATAASAVPAAVADSR